MPFDNFYEKFDRAERRWRWFLFCSIIFLPVVYLIVPALYSWYENYIPEMNEEQAERARHVDALCMGLPRPEQFNFDGRDPFLNRTNITSLTFRYRSERELEEIMPAFRVWFDTNGWTADADWESKFNKGNQSVVIQATKNDWGYFEVWCYERAPNSLSFETYD